MVHSHQHLTHKAIAGLMLIVAQNRNAIRSDVDIDLALLRGAEAISRETTINADYTLNIDSVVEVCELLLNDAMPNEFPEVEKFIRDRGRAKAIDGIENVVCCVMGDYDKKDRVWYLKPEFLDKTVGELQAYLKKTYDIVVSQHTRDAMIQELLQHGLVYHGPTIGFADTGRPVIELHYSELTED